MILKDYLDNPMGKGDSSIPNRVVVKAHLDEKYRQLMETKKIDYKIYRDTSTSFLIHLVIPSETERDNTYDVVFRFVPATKDIYNERSINNFDVQVFSNTPSFAYTFANVYDKHGLLIQNLKDKFSKTIFKKDPVVRNKFEIVNYEKYIYFATRYILDSKLLVVKDHLIGNARIYNSKKFSTIIRDTETIMVEYQRAAKKVRDDKRGKSSENLGSIKKNPAERVKTTKPASTPTNKVKTLKPNTKKPRGTSNIKKR